MSDEVPNFNEEIITDLTQCCGAIVWIYTDYREDGELMIPICFACKKQVNVDGSVI